jgi:hypothetical protein
MLSVILETIKQFNTGSYKIGKLISIQVEKLLNCMEAETPYRTTKLMEMLRLKSRSSFKNNYLGPAIESRNQRYIKIIT